MASFRAFCAGAFSARRDDPLRADAAALSRIDAAALARIFQVDPANPLVGLEGRAALLRRLGAALIAREEVFDELARPGGLFETLIPDDENALAAPDLLHALQDGLSSIWVSQSALDGVALGDVWRHPHAGGAGKTAGWVTAFTLFAMLIGNHQSHVEDAYLVCLGTVLVVMLVGSHVKAYKQKRRWRD